MQLIYICKLLNIFRVVSPHPSSGAHITVSTVSGIAETFTATCRERARMVYPIQSRSDSVDTVI